MSNVTIARSLDDRIKNNVFRAIKNLENLPRTIVVKDNDLGRISIVSDYQYLPDFKLVWCNIMKHFRVYIFIVKEEGTVKQYTGYPIMNISTGLIASSFVIIYHFLHRYRSNVKG